MDQAAVRQKMELFLQHLREEAEIRDELSSLDFNGVSEHEVQKALGRQSELLRQLDSVRQEKMLPVINEMAEFVSQRQIQLGLAKPPAKPAPPKAQAKAAAPKAQAKPPPKSKPAEPAKKPAAKKGR
ncbi:MAG: hypothetical protein HYZ28_20780 [Myxococcales bacterium]|nr:hypothetical protein [Myxococcales bacterium]